MSNIINAPVYFNNVPEQRLTYANQLTITAWNDIINTLRTQANAMALYLKRLDNWFFDENNPNNWYSHVEQTIFDGVSSRVPIGSLTDTYNTISYYGLKKRIDRKTVIYVGPDEPDQTDQLVDLWFDTNI